MDLGIITIIIIIIVVIIIFYYFMDGHLYYWWEINCKNLQACAQDCNKNRERKKVAEESMSSRHEK